MDQLASNQYSKVRFSSLHRLFIKDYHLCRITQFVNRVILLQVYTREQVEIILNLYLDLFIPCTIACVLTSRKSLLSSYTFLYTLYFDIEKHRAQKFL